METRANYALIGAFTLAVLAAAFGFIYWFAGRDVGVKRNSIRVVFSGSISGLATGSQVLFNGLRVGEVTRIELLPDDPQHVTATAVVDGTTPVNVDTRARLEFQGLTGVASVALTGGQANSAKLEAASGQPLPTIFADRSDFQDILETVRNISRRADDLFVKIDRVVADSDTSIVRTVKNVESFSQALAQNSDSVGRFLDSVGTAADKIGPLAARLDALAGNVDGLLHTVEPERVGRVVKNVEDFTQSLSRNSTNIDSSLKDVASLAKRLNDTAQRLDTALAGATGVLQAVDTAKISRAVDNADRFAQVLGRTSESTEKAIRDAASITDKLNHSADRVDGVLKAAETFLGSSTGEAGKSAFDQLADAARAIRVLAENLDTRSAEIASGINRTVRGLERNPQQILFGGKPSIPAYSGQR